ncbi:hypothetical protein AB67_4255 [Escherichia coli 5-366-08_S1_C3]|nr:hypothetical protein AB67_4255 [Escherichia coli 5-366-08_S1_C3]
MLKIVMDMMPKKKKNHTKSWNYQQVGLLKAPLNQTKLLVGFLL